MSWSFCMDDYEDPVRIYQKVNLLTIRLIYKISAKNLIVIQWSALLNMYFNRLERE